MAAKTRDPELLKRELVAIDQELAGQHDRRYAARLAGASRGIRWLMGHFSTAPVSSRPIERPETSDAYSEAMWADEVATGVRAVPKGVTHEHAAGVASGLMWALGRSHEAPSPLGDHAPLRERRVIEREYEANLPLAKNPPPQWSPGDIEEELGVLAALGWVLGKNNSPISGKAGGVDRVALESEMEAAQRLTGSDAPPSRLSRDFAGGVYDALSWVLEHTDNQPGPA